MRHQLRKLFPKTLMKILSMSKRQRWHELRASLWILPAIYIVWALLLGVGSYFLEYRWASSLPVPAFFSTSYDLTQTMSSAMFSGVLTLNAFTFNSILVVLTSFSGQFTPRMLFNFIADKRTQHALGIFNFCFFYLMLVFFFLNANSDDFTVFPLASVLVTAFAVLNFILFINHAAKWMQVPSIVNHMKEESQQRILNTLHYDLEPFRIEEPRDINKVIDQGKGHTIASEATGFLQVLDYQALIREAQKDDIVIRMDRRVGDFVMKGIPLLTYWKKSIQALDENKYRRMMYLGDRKTEVQDLEYGITKLTEIAIKAVGNNEEPTTAQDAIYQLADLLLSISDITRYSSCLTDSEDQLRMILQEESFSYYVYCAFGPLSSYAREDAVTTLNILEALAILTQAVKAQDKACCWEYASIIADKFSGDFAFAYERHQFHNALQKMAAEAEEWEVYQASFGN
ncbi:DUF2254 domain-containing protein [Marinococcus sp. PL1-022]|uniref:DUF2254 domain-containing protein n=1 Tax=Marinococcus sp. PL1-022 TaxID=3095363 RepID=UPI0029C34FE6|nr:DUF2254 domain-containing protein [Marinococcus sp. PL1-022]MDX6153205.1 DUF2254 domain-containing protein [Marinococcus sp. PL1-022]